MSCHSGIFFWGAKTESITEKLSQILELLRHHSGFWDFIGEAVLFFSFGEEFRPVSCRKITHTVPNQANTTSLVGFLHILFRFCAFFFLHRRQVAQAQNVALQGLKAELLRFLEKIRCLSQIRAFRVQSCGFFKRVCHEIFAKRFLGPAAPENSSSKKTLDTKEATSCSSDSQKKRHLDGEREGKLNAAQPSAPAGGFEGPKRAEIMDSE